MKNHEYYMAKAIQLAERGKYTTDPNPRVGCIIVKNNEIIGQGWHRKAGEGHAEVNALQSAGLTAQDSDCYVTLEPCSHFGRTAPCADALIKAKVKRVIVAMTDPNPLVSGQGVERLRQAGIEVVVGVLEQAARELNRGFCKRMIEKRPFVTTKIAMSIDGRTALSSGESKWITSPLARQDVQKMRGQHSAILTGVPTIISDNPSLTVRPEGTWYPENHDVRQPLRVIIDSQLKIPLDSNVLNDGVPTLIATAQTDHTPFTSPMVECVSIGNQHGKVDLRRLFTLLAEKGINNLMIEAGSELNGVLLDAGLIDEIVIYMAPKLMGNQARGIFDLPHISQMSDIVELSINDIRPIGHDWRLTLTPQYKKA
jgi:diaminohydroxyphosphoribosylaminopyrimidine deaminase/5-amino-6-(5-phosphoribosylamino)uracil reductase